MKKQLVVNLAKYGLAVALLSFVVWHNWDALKDAVGRPVQFGPLTLAFVFSGVGIVLTFVRWYVLVRAQDLPFTLWNALRLGMVGFFLSTFLPGSIGGDIVKAAFLAKEQSRRTVAVATVLIDRALGLLGLFWLVALTGSIFWWLGDPCLENRTLRGLVIASIGVAAASVTTWFLMGLLPESRSQRFAGRLENLPKVGHSLAEMWRAVWMYRLKLGYVVGAMSLGLIAQVSMVGSFYLAAQVFPERSGEVTVPSLSEHFLLVPVGLTVQALAPVPGGAGVGELGYGALYYEVMGTKAAEARGALASFVARVIGWALGLIGYIFYLVMKPSLPKTEEDDEKPAAHAAVTGTLGTSLDPMAAEMRSLKRA